RSPGEAWEGSSLLPAGVLDRPFRTALLAGRAWARPRRGRARPRRGQEGGGHARLLGRPVRLMTRHVSMVLIWPAVLVAAASGAETQGAAIREPPAGAARHARRGPAGQPWRAPGTRRGGGCAARAEGRGGRRRCAFGCSARRRRAS